MPVADVVAELEHLGAIHEDRAPSGAIAALAPGGSPT